MGWMRAGLAMAAAAALTAFAARASAQTDEGRPGVPAATTLDLSAEGEVKAAPDVAVVTVGVESDGPTAGDAMAGERTRMSAAIAALTAAGVAPSDIQTASLNLQAQYSDDGKGPRRLTGYQASNTVAVHIRDLSRTGRLIDALVAAGANQIEGVAFGISDPSPIEDQARRQAVQRLQARAELYAQATGYRVKRLVRLSEGGGFAQAAPVPMMMARRMATPVEPGELSVRIGVTAEYELTR